jgi:hypothetical protein
MDTRMQKHIVDPERTKRKELKYRKSPVTMENRKRGERNEPIIYKQPENSKMTIILNVNGVYSPKKPTN